MKHGQRNFPITRTLLATAIAACFAPLVFALPVAPTVTSGSATFAQNGNVLTVTNSNQAIINWQSFSIGRNETTKFVQPSASSSALNRVLSNDPSVLLGSLQSNGRVYLINPAGIMVGQGARIDVAGFVASTLNLSDSDFLANRLRFAETPGAGKLQNLGEITTPSGGNVYLVAPQVENSGIITAPNGEVLLAAGQRVELIDTATPGVRVEVVGSEGSATNLGTITAEAGRIGIAGVLVRNSGTLNASSVVSEGGRIFLKATTDTLVDGNSQITATGTKGGRIEVLGDRVAVLDNAQLDASGQTAGGTVLVGGDYQGKNAAVQNATNTTLGKQTSIKADAIDTGNGGKVVVWSDGTTSADGNISARGGANGGDGGFVEVSGKQMLNYRGVTDTRAARGKTGTLLLDPTAINLIAGAGTDGAGTFYGDNITTNLGSSNVILQTNGGGTGAITFTAGTYNFSGAAAANSLSLLAFSDGSTSLGNISLPSGTFITMKAGALLTMVAGWDGASTTTPVALSGFGNFAMTGASISAPGSVTLLAGANIDILNLSSVTNTTGDMKVKSGGVITLNGSTLSGSGTSQSVEAANSGSVQILANSSAPAAIAYYGSGAQTVKGGSISLTADTTASSNKTAQISTSLAGSSQTVQATAGGITLQAGNLGTNNFAGITAKASQTISATGAITAVSGTGGSSNSSGISSDGTQNITAGSIALTGGGGTGSGRSQIKAVGAQTITTTSGNLALTGGSNSISNEASIDSATSQTLSVSGNMTLAGGTAGGAIVSAPTQNISIGGTLTLTAGSGTATDAYGLAAPAAIGYDGNANITLNVGSSISLTGTDATKNPALIGSAIGSGTVYLRGTDILLANYGVIGNWDNVSSSSIQLIATGTSGINLNTNTKLLAGSTGSVALTANGAGGASVTQQPSSTIVAQTLSAIGNQSIALTGSNNNVSSFSGSSSLSSLSFTSNSSTVRVTSAQGAAGVTLATTAGTHNIALGSVSSTGGNVSVTASNAILDDNGSGVANVTTGTGAVTLTSTSGTTVPGELAISADVSTTGAVGATSGGTYGSIAIRDVGPAAVHTFTLNASAASNGGSVGYFRYGDLTMGAGGVTLAMTPNSTGTVGIGASGLLTVNNAFSTTKLLKLASVGAMTLNANVTGDLGLDLQAGALTLNSATAQATTGDLTVKANSIVATGGKLWALTGDAKADVAGDIKLNNGSSIKAGNDVYLKLAGGASTLYMNEITGMPSPSYVLATNPNSIHIDFLSRTADGIVINGVQTATSLPGASGLFVVNTATPAVAGAGLAITYGGSVSNPATNGIIDSAGKATDASGTGLADGTDSSGALLAGAGADNMGSGSAAPAGTDNESFGDGESGSGSNKESKDNAKNPKKKPAQCTA